MRTNRFFLLLLFTLAIVAGCGGGGNTDDGVSVTISPVQVTLSPGGSYQFTATVSGTGNTGVIWSVSPEGCGSVTATGLYTAPSDAGTYYVKATSKADPAKSAQATVTVVSGATSGNKYTGTITINNTGTEGGLVVNQSATIEVTLVYEVCPELSFTQYGLSDPSAPALVTANIDDQQTEGAVVTIKGSLTNAALKYPQLEILLQIKEATYNLFIVGVPVDCVLTANGVSSTQTYYVLGREDNEHSLPADQSPLTGNITSTVEGLPGITQEINWDLVLIK